MIDSGYIFTLLTFGSQPGDPLLCSLPGVAILDPIERLFSEWPFAYFWSLSQVEQLSLY
jgi:hypothetical protein